MAAMMADIKTVKTGTRTSLNLELGDTRVTDGEVGGAESIC